MTARFRRALVVGKFSPLHNGHLHLLDAARAACDELVIVSYSAPEFAHCEAAQRVRWLSAAFPDARLLVFDAAMLAAQCAALGQATRPLPANDASDAEQRQFVAWLCSAFLDGGVDAVFTSEAYGDGFASSLSSHFGLPVAHVCVDQARAAHPVSGTAVRSDPLAWRAHLPPHVAASFVERVCMLGGESSGKTTLARRLEQSLDTTWAPEYGRELWELRQGQLRYDDMLAIARTQVEREDALAAQAGRFLMCDTTPLTTLFYSQHLFDRADPALLALAERRYRHVFLCAPDFPFVQDGTRSGSALRTRQHAWYLEQLDARAIAFTLVGGPLEERVALVCARLAA